MKTQSYLSTLNEFCRQFASYVTRNWLENHLNIYIYFDDKPVTIACYGLGKVNWSGESDPEYPFHNSLQKLISQVPKGTKEIHVEFNCEMSRRVDIE